MKTPDFPLDEQARLQALRALRLLDTPPDPAFDRITELARDVLDTPIALVTLVDENRQWFKSRQGLDASETSRAASFCGHAILGNETFVVPDASRDERFHDNPLVTGAPDIRFYAGAPLHAPGGEHVGTLCVIDRKPRELNSRQHSALRVLAAMVDAEIAAHAMRDATATLMRQENYLRAVLDNISDGVLTIDRNNLILSANPTAGRILGYGNGKLVGMTATDFLVDTGIVPTRKDGRATIIECRIRRADGSVCEAEVTLTGLAAAPDPTSHRVLLLRDISERRRLERLKNEFIATVSHELRTPLTSIRGGLGLVAGGATGELPAKTKSVLDIALRNVERLSLLIDDLLDLEKLSSGAMVLQRSPVAVDELLILAKHSNDGYALRHEVRIEVTATVDTVLELDTNRMQQVLANLLSNAVKFSPKGGRVELSAQRQGDMIRIQVKDHGPGIPAEFRDRVFQRFAQADSSDTRPRGGTGLGLSISRAIVEQHGGRIGFETVTGTGTTFFLDLPVGKAT